MLSNIVTFLFQNNPMGFPDWYFSLLGGSLSPNYEAIIRMQEKMYNVSKVIFLLALVAAIGMFAFQKVFNFKLSPNELLMSFVLTLFVMVSYNQIFSTTIELSVAVSNEITSREDREDWAAAIRKKADERTGQNQSGWSLYSGYLGIVVTLALGGAPISIGTLLVAVAGAIFLIAAGVMWALWIVLVMALFAFGVLLVPLGVVPRWGTKIMASWFNALVILAVWNIYNAMCIWLMTTSVALFFDSAGMNDPNAFHAGRLLSTGGMTVVYTLLLMAGPIVCNALVPVSNFLGLASFGMEKAAGTATGGAMAAGAAVGGAIGGPPGAMAGAAVGGSAGNAATGGGGGGGGFQRTPSTPPGE